MRKFAVRRWLWSMMVLCALALTACGPALTPLPYADDFSTPNGNWKTTDDEAIKISTQDGALHFTIDDLDTIAWSTPKTFRCFEA